jgi:hypothetical protein
MRRKFIFFGTGFLLLCLAGWGIYKVLKPHRNAASEQTEATISASELYGEFQKGENLANQKWVGKVIEVTGRIASVTDAGNYVSVNLLATAEGNINCSVLKKDLNPGDKLLKGDSIDIKGKCTGFLMDVNLVDCIIKK